MLDQGHSFFDRLQNSRNILLVKDGVGKPKACVRDLPTNEHSYGFEQKKDRESAGAVISSWQEHKKSKDSEPDRDFKQLNKISVAQKCITATQVKEFRKTNDIRIKEARGKKDLTVSLPDPEFYFGIPNRPSTPIDKVVSNDYGNVASIEKHEVYSHISIQEPKPKRSISKQNKSISPAPAEKKEPFKLKKFQKVEPKVATYAKKST